MNKIDNKAEWDFFVTALIEEAREVIRETGSSVAPRDLIDGVLEELQALAVSADAHDKSSDEHVWGRVRAILVKAAYLTRPHCIRCGTCCMKGSPTLTKDDLKLFNHDVLNPRHVVTIREGEMAYCNRTESIGPVQTEMIKIREFRETTTCIFYEQRDKKCSIYESRPEQCRLQQCWHPEGSEEQCPPALNRRDILKTVSPLWEIILRHEDRCSYAELERSMARLAATKGETVGDILSILAFDHHVRQFVIETFSLDPEMMEFFFGKELKESIGRYGLTVEESSDGSFMLTQSSSAVAAQ
jgi:Fe-S-cluster containining protein